MGRSTYARSLRVGVAIGLVLALVAAAALVLGRDKIAELAGGTAAVRNASQVLIVAASPDDAGAVVAQIIARVDIPTGKLVAEEPSSAVTISGTSYDTLKDAYAFGGGQGVASAYAQLHDADVLPYVAIGPQVLTAAVDAQGGVQLTLPVPMTVFDGEQLFSFAQGPVTLSGAQLAAVLKGAPYLTPAQRTVLNASLAEMYADLLGNWKNGLASARDDNKISTDLAPAMFDSLQDCFVKH